MVGKNLSDVYARFLVNAGTPDPGSPPGQIGSGGGYGVNFKSLGAKGDAVVNDAPVVVQAINQGVKLLHIPSGTYRLLSGFTVPEDMFLSFENGARFLVDTGVTITINGGIIAGAYQIFSGLGTVTGKIKNESAYPQWFGAKADRVTDDTAAFNKAFGISSQVTVPGDRGYLIQGTVTVPRGSALIGTYGSGGGGQWGGSYQPYPVGDRPGLTNSMPRSGLPTLLLDNWTESPVKLYGPGATIKNFALLWPNQDTPPTPPETGPWPVWNRTDVLEAPWSILAQEGNGQVIEHIVDQNSWNFLKMEGTWSGALVQDIWSQCFWNGIWCERSEAQFNNVHYNDGTVYNSGYNVPTQPEISNMGSFWLPDNYFIYVSGGPTQFQNIGINGRHVGIMVETWWGVSISDSWIDLCNKAIVIKDPAYGDLNLGGKTSRIRLDNVELGSGNVSVLEIDLPAGVIRGGASDHVVQISNVLMDRKPIIRGSMNIMFSNCFIREGMECDCYTNIPGYVDPIIKCTIVGSHAQGQFTVKGSGGGRVELNTAGLLEAQTNNGALTPNVVSGTFIDRRSQSSGALHPLSGKKVNIIGDSLTMGVGTAKTYHAYLAEDIGLATVRNYGIGGSTVADGGPQAMCQRVNDMDPDADVVIFWGGTNDFGEGTGLPLGSLFSVAGDGTLTPNSNTFQFYGALHKLAKDLIARYPGKLIIWMTPLHREEYQGKPTDRKKNARGFYLFQYVNAIKEVGSFYGIPVLDMYALSGIDPNNAAHRTLYYDTAGDTVHPNAAGHQVIYKKLRAFLDAPFGAPMTEGAQATSAGFISAPAYGGAIVMGDSIAACGVGEPNYRRPSWLQLACVESQQRMNYIRNSAVPGRTTAEMLAVFDAEVIAYKPTFCFIAGGTNDIDPATAKGATEASTRANLTAMVDKCKENNIIPILCTLMPRTDGLANAQQMVNKLNTWIHQFGRIKKVMVLDLHSAVVDGGTGGWKSGYVVDGVHPDYPGYGALGRYCAQQMANLLPPWTPYLSTWNDDPVNMLKNGMFLNHSSGIPTDWTVTNSNPTLGTMSVGQDSYFLGNYCRMNKTGTMDFTMEQEILTGFATGDVLQFAGKVKTGFADGQMQWEVQISFIGGAGTNQFFPAAFHVNAFANGGILHMQMAIPAGTTSIKMRIWSGPGAGWIEWGQFTLVNLSQQGSNII